MTARKPEPPGERVPIDERGGWRSFLKDAKGALASWQKYGIHGFLMLLVGVAWYLAVDRRELVKERKEAREERDSMMAELTEARAQIATLCGRVEEGSRGWPEQIQFNINILTDRDVIGEGITVDVGKLPELVQQASGSP